MLVDFLHQAAGYPMKKSWLTAIRLGFYATLLGLLYKLVSKFLPNDTKETAAGHLHCRQQGVQSIRRNNQLEEFRTRIRRTRIHK